METIYDSVGNEGVYFENNKCKIVEAKDGSFHHLFVKENGFSMVYGKTRDEDPDYSAFGPLIADIEITTICRGPRNEKGVKVPCSFCYKSNTTNGSYMSLETFKEVFKRLPKTIGQIAFGVDASATSNPDIWKIFEYCRENGVVPNLTVADIDDEVADKIASLAGACAVSLYDNKDICYESVKKLTDRGMKQVNIHFCYTDFNIARVQEIINDIKNDQRLSKLNAIVFLALKQKGRGKTFKCASFEKFKDMVDILIESGISYGFDSCSAQSLLRAIKGTPYIEKIEKYIESCESTRMSLYIDVDGFFYPCSFMEKIGDWKDGIDVKTCNDFISEIWENPRTQNFRKGCLSSIKNGIGCQYYNI